MRVDPIWDKGVKLLIKILGYKLNHGSRINYVQSRFIHTTYVMVVKRRKVNLCDIVKVQLSDNIAKIKKTKSAVFICESLLTHLFFYTTKKFPGVVIWDSNECAMKFVTQSYRSKPKNVRDIDIDRMVNIFILR